MQNLTLFKKFRKMYEQAFVPIFAKDDFDTDILLEGCALAGITFIEYTLRREDAKQVIPTLKKKYPQLMFTVGSTIDSEKIVKNLSLKYPQLMTIQEVADCGADGIVSMLPMSSECLQKYSDNLLMIPGASNSWDALRQLRDGAHFIKITGDNLQLVRSLNLDPAFKFCPVFTTGGFTPFSASNIADAGPVLMATGMEIMLKCVDKDALTPERVAEEIKLYCKIAKDVREAKYPALKGCEKLTDEEFVKVLPNYCPFD